jgi:hypothetical protein
MPKAMHRLVGSVSLALAVMALQGCAAIPLAAVVGPVLEAGGGVLVKTGTEYTASGTAYRTFTLPVDDVHAGVLEAFRRTQVAVERDESSAKDEELVGLAGHRTVRVRLTPLTPSLTSMELDVKRSFFTSDKATTSELLAQTESVLAENPRYRMQARAEAVGVAPIVAPRRAAADRRLGSDAGPPTGKESAVGIDARKRGTSGGERR